MDINTAINLLNLYKGKNLHEVAKLYNINENNFFNDKENIFRSAISFCVSIL